MGSIDYYITTFAAIATAGAILYVLYRARRGKLAVGNSDLPRCANCRYALVNLPSNICPECGKDVTTAGVIPPNVCGFPPFHLFLIWTFLFVAIVFASTYIPYGVRSYTTNTLHFDTLTYKHFDSSAGPSFLICSSSISAEGEVTLLARENPAEVTLRSASATLSFNSYDITIEAIPNPPRYRLPTDVTWHPYVPNDIYARCEPLLPVRGDTSDQDALKTTIKNLNDTIKVANINALPGSYISNNTKSKVVLSAWPLVYLLILPLWTFGMVRLLPRARMIKRGDEALQLVATQSPQQNSGH